MSDPLIPTITPIELKAELESPNPPKLLDVREPHELEISRLANVVHIPLGQIPAGVGELDKDAAWVVICRSGMRSAQATEYMLGQGFTNVRNLTSGMNGYAQTADSSYSVY